MEVQALSRPAALEAGVVCLGLNIRLAENRGMFIVASWGPFLLGTVCSLRAFIYFLINSFILVCLCICVCVCIFCI